MADPKRFFAPAALGGGLRATTGLSLRLFLRWSHPLGVKVAAPRS